MASATLLCSINQTFQFVQKGPEWLKTPALNLLCRTVGQS
jgi:hypothetical protein